MPVPPVWITIFHRPTLRDDEMGRLIQQRVEEPWRVVLLDDERPTPEWLVAPVEDAFADALVLLVEGDAGRALAVLARLSSGELERRYAVGLRRSRAEALLVAGRPQDALVVLDEDRMLLPRCWRAAARAWAGDRVGASAEYDELEAAVANDEVGSLQLAWHAAFVGEFDRCARQFERLLALPPAQCRSVAEDWRGLAKTAVLSAHRGWAAKRARPWARDFMARLEALAGGRSSATGVE